MPTVNALKAIAPGRRILLAQTGVGNLSDSARVAWGQSLVSALRAVPEVIGFLWFDIDKECDWRYTTAEWRSVVGSFDWRSTP